MKNFLFVLSKIYGWLLCFYPRTFRDEFGEEMLLDFRDMLDSVSQKGVFAPTFVLLRELRDIPINTLRIYMQDGRMLKIFRSQPVNAGLRSALGFGVAFGVATIVSGLVFLQEINSENSILTHLQIFYFDVFHKESGLLFNWFFSVIGSMLTGLVFGILFALLFADRSRYPRYILVSMLGWLLHDSVRGVLNYFFDLQSFLGSEKNIYFNIMTSVLSGAFLGLIFIVVKSERNKPINWLIIGAFVYPLITYLYVGEVYKISVFISLGRFIALTILMVIFMGSIILIAAESETERKMLWLIAAGAIGYPIMGYLLFFISHLIFPANPSWGYNSDHLLFWLNLAGSNAVFGILIGLLLGLVLGFQRKNNSLPIST